jgi:hypothetical protein
LAQAFHRVIELGGIFEMVFVREVQVQWKTQGSHAISRFFDGGIGNFSTPLLGVHTTMPWHFDDLTVMVPLMALHIVPFHKGSQLPFKTGDWNAVDPPTTLQNWHVDFFSTSNYPSKLAI